MFEGFFTAFVDFTAETLFHMVDSYSLNQTPEQRARDEIDNKLSDSGWSVQEKNRINWQVSQGIAVRHYPTQNGQEADYVLFVDRKPVGIIEAKKEAEGHHLTVVEDQSTGYAGSKLKHLDNDPLPFVYESTGIVTRFTDYRDPKPRSRPVFTFHRPETFREWLSKEKSLRDGLLEMPVLNPSGLRHCQTIAINNLERSLRDARPRALIQMATGSGKTFTAITFIYRLLKHTDAKRVLFLVDTRNLGEQAEQEFRAYTPNDDNRKFVELYNVQRLQSSSIAGDSQVCITTIQRLYSILKGVELDASLEEDNPEETSWQPKEPVPVAYNEKVPIEFFDFIVIDECHRSIYNLWKQVLDYFDAFLIGLTATPDKRTFGFFNENIVSEYSHERAVADGVNVGYDVYIIETDITRNGAEIKAKEFIDKREKLTRRKRWEQLDEDMTYTPSQLDRDVVNPSQIRNVIKTFREILPVLFPGRTEVPKTLVFAKTDSHAEDIIQIIREEFNEGNAFCNKITCKADDPKSMLARFRNEYNPRIAVTVDMIATGTDVKPLECLLFMRDIKSSNYFEQMKGRGTRTLSFDDLKKVTPSVTSAKTHFVIVDAIGVTKSLKTDSRPLERKPSASLKTLLEAVTFGAQDEDLFISLANRLARLEKQITEQERAAFIDKTGGKSINQVVRELLDSWDPDRISEKAQDINGAAVEEDDDNPSGNATMYLEQAQQSLLHEASSTFNGELNEFIDNVRRVHEQMIDTINLDHVIKTEWATESADKAKELIGEFKAYLEAHKDEITALKIFYNQPYQRRSVTYRMIREVLDRLMNDKPLLAPMRIWYAYEQIEKVNGANPKNELIALVSLIRRATDIDQMLTAYDKTVDANFKQWVFNKHSGASEKFTAEQMNWLRMIKEHIASSIHMEADDLDLTPFDGHGGKGRMWQLFGDRMEAIIEELNEVLTA